MKQHNFLTGARVYLSGPMDFVASRAVEKQFGWRNRVSQFLQKMGTTVFDPWFKPDVRGLHEYGREDVKSGHKIEFRGEGDQMPGVLAGDVVFEIEQKPHARFQRKDDDLFYHAEIDLLTALGGGQIYIEHLDDRWLTVNIYPGEPITPGEFPDLALSPVLCQGQH